MTRRKFFGVIGSILLAPLAGRLSDASDRDKMIELIRRTRPEAAGAKFISDDAIRSFRQLEAMESAMIIRRLRRQEAALCFTDTSALPQSYQGDLRHDYRRFLDHLNV